MAKVGCQSTHTAAARAHANGCIAAWLAWRATDRAVQQSILRRTLELKDSPLAGECGAILAQKLPDARCDGAALPAAWLQCLPGVWLPVLQQQRQPAGVGALACLQPGNSCCAAASFCGMQLPVIARNALVSACPGAVSSCVPAKHVQAKLCLVTLEQEHHEAADAASWYACRAGAAPAKSKVRLLHKGMTLELAQ